VKTEGFTQSGAPYQNVNPLFGITPPDLGLGNNSGRSNFGFNVGGTPVNGSFNPNTGGFRGNVNTGLGTFGGTYNPGTGSGSVSVPGGSGFSFP
jgi:hypothetical protein